MWWRRLALALGALLVVIVAGQLALTSLMASIKDGKCRAMAREPLEVAKDIEEYRRVNGHYPVASSVQSLRATMSTLSLSSHSPGDGPDLLYESDGSAYTMVYFPFGLNHPGGYCSCFALQTGRFVGFPPAVTERTVRRLNEDLSGNGTP